MQNTQISAAPILIATNAIPVHTGGSVRRADVQADDTP
jgi:hypothetical protein